MRRKVLTIACAAAGVSLAGCAHNDVLVFGTDTKFALDVEGSATEGGSPSITVGYKRKEAVWMPLVVNAKDSVIARPCTGNGNRVSCGVAAPNNGQGWDPDSAKYKSTITTYKDDGITKASEQTDTYSVFASLGAQFNGSTQGTNLTAGGGIAQFFATGNAAVNISQNKALVTALKVSDPGSSQAQANAVKAATLDTASLYNGIDPEVVKAAQDQQNAALALENHKIALILMCSRGSDGAWRWGSIVDATSYSAGAKDNLKKITDESMLRTRLLGNDPLIAASLTAGGTLGCTTN
jgi:hypothetical protein